MANVVIKPDRFTAVPEALIRADLNRASDAQTNVRRPTGGIEIKPDRYGSLRVVASTGTAQSLINTSAPNVVGELSATYTTNLLIQTVQESREEKSQVIQTFGADFVYFFGERPVQLQVSAQLIDANNFRWHQEWWENYGRYLRGTELVQRDARAYLEIDDVMYEGYITSASTQRTADTQHNVALSFSFLVTNKVFLRELVNSYSAGDTQSFPGVVSAADVAAASALTSALQDAPVVGQLLRIGNVTQGASELTRSISTLRQALSYYDEFPDEYVARERLRANPPREVPPTQAEVATSVSALGVGRQDDIARGGVGPVSVETAASTPNAPISASLAQSAARGSAQPAAAQQTPVARQTQSIYLVEPQSRSVRGAGVGALTLAQKRFSL